MKRFVFQFINEWSQLFGEWNWVTFTFINIEFENDKMTQGLELLFIVLGFGFRIRYNKPSSDAIFAKYDEMIEKEFPNIK